MIDDFFDNHEIDLSVFASGLAVIICLLFGGCISNAALVVSMHSQLADVTHDRFAIVLGVGILVIVALSVIPNVLIVTGGKPWAVRFNKLFGYGQVICFLVIALAPGFEDKRVFSLAVVFPLFALWLMSTTKYKTFVGFYEAIRKDPEGYRRRVLGE